MKRAPGKDAAPPLSVGMAPAAKMLGIGRRKLWSLVNQRAIPHYRVGAKILFPIADLKAWIDDQVIGGTR